MTAEKKNAAQSGGPRGARTLEKSERPAGNAKPTGKPSIAANDPKALTAELRPMALAVHADGIPASLRALDRWVLWQYRLRNRKWTKVPLTLGGVPLDATDLNNGQPLAEVLTAVRAYPRHFDGIGFLLGSGIGGIDVDDCITSNGLDERGQTLSARFKQTYAETSPSGKGFKALVQIDAAIDTSGKGNGIEVYSQDRYFTVTGRLLAGHAPDVSKMTAAFEQTAQEVGAAKTHARSVQRKPPIGLPLKVIREALEYLSPKFYAGHGNYDPWLSGIMALHHETRGTAEGLQLAKELSARDPSQYDEAEVEAKWESLGRKGRTEEVTFGTIASNAKSNGWKAPPAVEQAMREFAPVYADQDGAFRLVNPLRFPPRVTRDILTGPIRLPDEAESCIVFGQSGSFKSVAVEGWLVHAAAGVSLDHTTMHAPRVVVYAAEEAPALFDNNLWAWRQYFGKVLQGEVRRHALRNLDADYFQRFDASLGGLTEHAAECIAHRVAEQKARLRSAERAIVALDPVAEVLQGDENSTVDMRGYIAAGRVVQRQADALVVHVHHTGHGTGERERGSSALPSSGFARYRVERIGGPSGMQCRVSCHKWKGGGQFPVPSQWGVQVEDLRLGVPDIRPGEECSGVVIKYVGPATMPPTVADIAADADQAALAEIVNAYNTDPKTGGNTLRAILNCGGPKLKRLLDLACERGYLTRGKGEGRASYIATDTGRAMADCAKPDDDEDD